MTDPTPPDLVALALALVAEHGWRRFSFAELARCAGTDLAVVYAELPDRPAILRVLGRRLDAEMLAIDMAELDGLTPRERLFELVMRRLDAMAPFKPGLRAIGREAPCNPGLLVAACCNVDRLGRRLVDAAGIAGDRLHEAIARRAIGVIYLRAFRVWLADETPDMARTLAELDRRLQQAETTARWAERLRPRSRPASPSDEAAPA